MSTPRFYSVREVADLLGIRTHGVLALIKSGALVAYDVSLQQGRPRWRVSSESIENFLLVRQHQTTPPRKRRRKKRPAVKQYF